MLMPVSWATWPILAAWLAILLPCLEYNLESTPESSEFAGFEKPASLDVVWPSPGKSRRRSRTCRGGTGRACSFSGLHCGQPRTVNMISVQSPEDQNGRYGCASVFDSIV